jgi:hypothetical protein
MSRRPRRNHTPAFKAKVALAAIKGDKTASGAFEESQQGVAAELRPLDHRAAIVETDHVEHILAEIDAVDGAIPWRVSDHDLFLLPDCSFSVT